MLSMPKQDDQQQKSQFTVEHEDGIILIIYAPNMFSFN